MSEPKTNYNDLVYNEDFIAEDPPDKTSDEKKSKAAAQGNFRSQIADIQLAQRIVNLAVSIVQKFSDTTTRIHNILLQMQTLAQKVTSGSYSLFQKATIQNQMEDLANQINSLVADTAYQKNKFLTPDGEPILFYISENRIFELAPADLSIDVKNLDLTKDTFGTLTAINNKLEQANLCVEYCSSQTRFLENTSKDIEKEFAMLMAVKQDNLNINTAHRLLNSLENHILVNVETSSLAQHNVAATTVVRLLK